MEIACELKLLVDMCQLINQVIVNLSIGINESERSNISRNHETQRQTCQYDLFSRRSETLQLCSALVN
jgi:hypothetical protein